MKSDFTMDSRARLSAALMKARQSSIALAASAALNSPRVDKLNDAEIAAWQAVDMAVEAHVAALTEERDRLAGALGVIEDESVFNQQRFAEDTDTDYFLRCFGAVKARARSALNPT